MKINNKNYYPKTVRKYLRYILWRLSLCKTEKFDGINLRYDRLLERCSISPDKQYYTGFLKFMKDNKVIECVKDSYCNLEPNRAARLYKVNIPALCNVMNEVLIQTNFNFVELEAVYKLSENQNIDKVSSFFFKDCYSGNTGLYRPIIFTSEDVYLKTSDELQRINTLDFIIRYRPACLEPAQVENTEQQIKTIDNQQKNKPRQYQL